MKQSLLIVIVLAVILGGIALSKKGTVTVVNNEPQVIEKEVQVDALEEAIKSAQNAKSSEIKASAQKAYDEAYSQEMKKVELQVIDDFTKQLELRQETLEGELSL